MKLNDIFDEEPIMFDINVSDNPNVVIRISADRSTVWIRDSKDLVIRITGIKNFRLDDDKFPGE